MRLGIKPTVDLIFKALFGDERHVGLTRSFLNAILAEIGRPTASTLEILNPFRPGHFSADKDIVLDIQALDEDMVLSSFAISRNCKVKASSLDRGSKYR